MRQRENEKEREIRKETYLWLGKQNKSNQDKTVVYTLTSFKRLEYLLAKNDSTETVGYPNCTEYHGNVLLLYVHLMSPRPNKWRLIVKKIILTIFVGQLKNRN